MGLLTGFHGFLYPLPGGDERWRIVQEEQHPGLLWEGQGDEEERLLRQHGEGQEGGHPVLHEGGHGGLHSAGGSPGGHPPAYRGLCETGEGHPDAQHYRGEIVLATAPPAATNTPLSSR